MDILVQATGKILVLRHVAGAGPGRISTTIQYEKHVFFKILFK